jgi:hypothetical protein
MKKIPFLAITLIAFSTLFFGCQKDLCDSVVCLNGGTCANGQCNCPTGYTGSDCSIEAMPTSVRINSMTLSNYPMTTTSGGGWDALAGNGPDVFLTVNTGTSSNRNSFVSGIYNNVLGQSLFYTNGLPLTLNDPNNYYTIGVWDEDTGAYEFMTGVYFIPNYFKTGFPATITLNTANMTVVLNVTWLF